MSKQKRTAKPAEPHRAPADVFGGWRPFALLGALVLIFYWTPLTSPHASIQWDAVDTHYSPQKYFSDQVRAGKLPFWTPYIFSGFPFLADPQVGAWYPLNWPFFLVGITPRAIQIELELHALLAVIGAYLLILRLVVSRPAAIVGSLCYSLSGFFAAHSSHVGMFQTAAGLPWLLLMFHRGNAAVGGLIGGAMILAGHFQTSLYSFAALGLFAAAIGLKDRDRWLTLTSIIVIAVLISSIAVLPGIELTRHSIRAGADFSNDSQGALPSGALATLVLPNFLGALSGQYMGPEDITQYYFYASVWLLPLAALGLRDAKTRLPALLLIVPALWYALGPAAGLYRLIAALPGFGQVRAPVHAWFVVAFGLSILSAAGAAWVFARWKIAWLPAALIAILFVDLAWWNSWNNPLAYARASFEQLYGARQAQFAGQIASTQPPLTRFHAPAKLTAFGPMNHPLDTRVETTYGYNPLELKTYSQYRNLDALNVTRTLNMQRGTIDANPSAAPRVTFPHKEDPAASVAVVAHDEHSYRVHYRAAVPSLLRLSVAWFPGWRATVDGQPLQVVAEDTALIGVTVPAGEKDVEFRFRSNYFQLGAWLSVIGLATAALAFRFRL